MGDNPEEAIILLRERVTALETHWLWIKEALKRIEARSWWILGSVVALGLIACLIALYT